MLMRAFATLLAVFLAAGLLRGSRCEASDTLTIKASAMVDVRDGDQVCAMVFPEGGPFTVIVTASSYPRPATVECHLDGTNFMEIVVDQEETPYSETIDIAPGRRDLLLHHVGEGARADVKFVSVVALDGQAPPTLLRPEQYEQDLDARRQAVLDEADARVLEHRRGRMSIHLATPGGEPVTGVLVRAYQSRHAFEFGGMLAPGMFDAAFPEETTRKYLDEAQRLFSAAVPDATLTWARVEPVPGTRSYDALDRMAYWCRVNEMAFQGPELFRPCVDFAPPWAVDLAADGLAEKASDYAADTVARLKANVADYSIGLERCGEPLLHAGMQFTAELFLAAARDGVRLFVHVTGMEDSAAFSRSIAEVHEMLSRGIPVGGVALHVDASRDVDVLIFRQALSQLGELRLPVKVILSPCDEPRSLEHLLRIGFGEAVVEGIYAGGVLRDDLARTPAQQTYEALVMEDWLTQETGLTDAGGSYSFTGFFGRYSVTLGEGDAGEHFTVDLARTNADAYVSRTWREP